MKLTDTYWYHKHVKNRRLMDTNESGMSVLQFIGFAMGCLGVLYLIYKIIFPCKWGNTPIDGEKMALTFFLIMTCIFFAFSSILKDPNKGMSTMRMMAFMIVNVICSLLLKIGWGKPNFESIGIDWYWAAIVAIVFGTVTIHAFFENRTSAFKNKNGKTNHLALINSEHYSELVVLAIKQNIENIKKIKGFVDMHPALSTNPKTNDVYCIIIDTALNNRQDYPVELHANLSSGVFYPVNVEVVTNFKVPTAHANSGDDVCNQNFTYIQGTVCCPLKIVDRIYFLSCSHVMSGGDPVNYGGLIDRGNDMVLCPSTNFSTIGSWNYGLLDDTFDIALIDPANFQEPYASNFAPDAETYNVNMIGKKIYINGNKTQSEAYIIGYSSEPIPFNYNQKIHTLKNLIKVSKFQFQYTGLTISGDSGAIAYFTDTNKALGMVIGSNDQYTYLQPMNDILNKLKATIY